MTLPWLARAQADNLYLPGDLIHAIRAPWHPSRTIAMLAGHCVTRPMPKPKPATSPCSGCRRVR